jgi:cbb3-type cytochrome oxidase subunit 1
MGRIPTLFFAGAAISALVGMAWGIQMSATHDHALSPAHGHLNLLGFVAMAVFGSYYALVPAAGASRLAGAHLGLHVAAVVVLAPGIAFAIRGQGEGLAQAGSILAILSMALFAFMVLRHGLSRSSGTAAHPAE